MPLSNLDEFKEYADYNIDTHGNVWSCKTNKKYAFRAWRKMKPYLTGNGYHRICLYGKSSRGEKFAVHKIVALAFIPKKQGKPFINHINGIKTDNRVENLEWCTASENTKHAYSIGHSPNNKGQNHGMSKLIDANINEIFEMRRMNFSQKSIATHFNVSKSTICEVLQRKKFKHIVINL